MVSSNPYLPRLAEVLEVKEESPEVKTLKLKLKEGRMEFKAGQFLELTVFGVGEAPFTFSSSPFNLESFEVSIANVGSVTGAAHQLKGGELVGVRGPFGNGFPLEENKGRDLVIVGGGIGIAPLRSLLYALVAERSEYGDLKLLYGARSPSLIIYKDEWEKFMEKGVEVYLTVDVGDETWRCGPCGPCGYTHVGVVTTLFDMVKLNPERCVAFVCGPPIMIKFTVQRLLQLGFPASRIYLSLERMMKCGLGKCGHCNIEGYYVCKDGPVFQFEMLKDIPHPF
jgi:NAD(P)H-flavin reductase